MHGFWEHTGKIHGVENGRAQEDCLCSLHSKILLDSGADIYGWHTRCQSRHVGQSGAPCMPMWVEACYIGLCTRVQCVPNRWGLPRPVFGGVRAQSVRSPGRGTDKPWGAGPVQRHRILKMTIQHMCNNNDHHQLLGGPGKMVGCGKMESCTKTLAPRSISHRPWCCYARTARSVCDRGHREISGRTGRDTRVRDTCNGLFASRTGIRCA